MKRSLRCLFLLVGRPPLAEFSLDEPGGPLHGSRLLRLWGGLAEQVAALLVLKTVQEQKPSDMLSEPRRVGSLRDRLPKEIAGLVDPQLLFSLLATLEGRGRLHRLVVEWERQHAKTEDGDQSAVHNGRGCGEVRGGRTSVGGMGMPRSSP